MSQLYMIMQIKTRFGLEPIFNEFRASRSEDRALLVGWLSGIEPELKAPQASVLTVTP